MGDILILNGSPRAPISNSAKYGEIFCRSYKGNCRTLNITKADHQMICSEFSKFTDVLFVFPLYVDGLPVPLLNFLKSLEQEASSSKPVISVLINCGFREPHQNDTAVKMIRFFCEKNGYPFGSALKIGGGEAILGTPFRFLAKRKIKALAASVSSRKYATFNVSMPLSASAFVKASTRYWIQYGQRNGITKEDMDRMEIEN